MRRILIDECINPRLVPLLRRILPGFSVESVRDLGWSGQKDHVLISEIEGRFDFFLTLDKGFEFEHSHKKRSFGIIVLTTANNQISSYERLLEDLVRQILNEIPNRVVHVIDPNF